MTRSPAPFSTGWLSPVSMASLTLLSPFSTTPSAAILLPGFSKIRSPRCSWLVGISLPLSARMAVSGFSSISFVMAPLVFCTLRASRNLPSMMRVSTTAADS